MHAQLRLKCPRALRLLLVPVMTGLVVPPSARPHNLLYPLQNLQQTATVFSVLVQCNRKGIVYCQDTNTSKDFLDIHRDVEVENPRILNFIVLITVCRCRSNLTGLLRRLRSHGSSAMVMTTPVTMLRCPGSMPTTRVDLLKVGTGPPRTKLSPAAGKSAGLAASGLK